MKAPVGLAPPQLFSVAMVVPPDEEELPLAEEDDPELSLPQEVSRTNKEAVAKIADFMFHFPFSDTGVIARFDCGGEGRPIVG